jgi:hypothetical protein
MHLSSSYLQLVTRTIVVPSPFSLQSRLRGTAYSVPPAEAHDVWLTPDHNDLMTAST